MMNNLSFICNNVKGIQAISKRIKIFEYTKIYVISNSFIFPQETHPPSKMKRYGVANSKGSYFLIMVKPTPIVIGFVGTKALNILNIKRDNFGRILVIEVKIDGSLFVLINIYQTNTEPKQLYTLNDLLNVLESFEDIQNEDFVLGGDFDVILNPSLDSKGGNPVIKKEILENSQLEKKPIYF